MRDGVGDKDHCISIIAVRQFCDGVYLASHDTRVFVLDTFATVVVAVVISTTPLVSAPALAVLAILVVTAVVTLALSTTRVVC